jgi:hypothetical protein
VRRHSRRSGARRRLGSATMERRAQGQTSGAVSSACVACARLAWALLLLAQLRAVAAAYLACPGSCADLWDAPLCFVGATHQRHTSGTAHRQRIARTPAGEKP